MTAKTTSHCHDDRKDEIEESGKKNESKERSHSLQPHDFHEEATEILPMSYNNFPFCDIVCSENNEYAEPCVTSKQK